MRPRTGVAAFATFMTAAGVLAATAAGATAAHASTTAAARRHDFGQTRLIPGDLLVSTSYYRNDPNIVAGHDPAAARLHRRQLRHRDRQRQLPVRLQQRLRGRQLRRHLAALPGGDHPVGLAAGRHPGADGRAEHQLLVEVGGRAQPVDRRPAT